MTSFIEKFLSVARQYPQSIAVSDERRRVTYRELDERSNAIARMLRGHYVEGRENLVALLLPRDSCFPVAAIGCLKAGMGYIPLSEDYPVGRINAILDETEAGMLVTTSDEWEAKGEDLHINHNSLLLADKIDWDAADGSPFNFNEPDKVAFILFTSGTAGKPKGVVYDNSAFVNAIRNLFPDGIESKPELRILNVADTAFMMSVLMIYYPLYVGGTAYIVSASTVRDLPSLAEYINKNDINTSMMPPQLCVALQRNFKTSLKCVFMGGDKAANLAEDMKGECTYINLYGMTECAPIATHIITFGEEIIPIGLNQNPDGELFIMDNELHPVPPGTIGEICYTGNQMSKGYYNMPELTAERFVNSPYDKEGTLLRTGDRAYMDKNGEIVLCGRTDNMIKLRGLRIETGEVENCAMSHQDVANAVCVVRPVGNDEQLCLYYDGPRDISGDEMKKYMSSRLAAYMIPSVFIYMNELPRNARGKIDRLALPEPGTGYKVLMIPPANEKEEILLDAVAKELGHREFGVTDDIFSLGITSLSAMKTVAAVERLGIKLKVADFMRYKTIREVLLHNMQMCYWYNYDESKPIMVLTLGLVLYSNAEVRIKYWSQFFSIIIIEPIADHYSYIFEGEDTEEIIKLYCATIDIYLPPEAVISVFAGFSYGGKLAYLLANEWNRLKGQKPAVWMGDTILKLPAAMLDLFVSEGVKSYIRNSLNKEYVEKIGSNIDGVVASLAKRLSIMAKIELHGVNMPIYDGPVYMLHAEKNSAVDKPEGWRDYAHNLTLIPVPADHHIICLDFPETMPYWVSLTEKTLSFLNDR